MLYSPIPSVVCEEEGKKVMPPLSRSFFLLLLSSCCLVLLLSFGPVPEAAAVARRTPSVGTTLSTYTGHRNAVSAVVWSPDGTRLASADDDGIVRVWQAPVSCRCASHEKEQQASEVSL